MIRVSKYMKEYSAMIVIVIALLFVQAYCDLALPQYTSDIIDTGIQNKGINHVMPEKILSEEFDYAKLFMNEDEQKKWDKSYKQSGDVYKLNDISEKELDKFDEMSPFFVNLYEKPLVASLVIYGILKWKKSSTTLSDFFKH